MPAFKTSRSRRSTFFSSPATLGDLGADADAGPGRAVRGVDIARVKADEFAEAQPGAKRHRDDQVVALVLGRGAEDQALLVLREGRRVEMCHSIRPLRGSGSAGRQTSALPLDRARGHLGP